MAMKFIQYAVTFDPYEHTSISFPLFCSNLQKCHLGNLGQMPLLFIRADSVLRTPPPARGELMCLQPEQRGIWHERPPQFQATVMKILPIISIRCRSMLVFGNRESTPLNQDLFNTFLLMPQRRTELGGGGGEGRGFLVLRVLPILCTGLSHCHSKLQSAHSSARVNIKDFYRLLTSEQMRGYSPPKFIA